MKKTNNIDDIVCAIIDKDSGVPYHEVLDLYGILLKAFIGILKQF